MPLYTPKQNAFMKLLEKYGLEGCADINDRINFPDSGYFLVPIIKEGVEVVEFPFEFLVELDYFLRRMYFSSLKWRLLWKMPRVRNILGKKFTRNFCFKIEPATTIGKLYARIEAERMHFSLANACYE